MSTNRRIRVLTALAAVLCAAPAATGAKKAPAKTGPAPPAMVRRVKVVADKAPDCSSLKSIVATVTRGCKTNDEKGIAIYNFGRMAWYHHAYPGEKGGIPALKLINVYGWSLCGGQHTALAALWRAAGWNWRYIGWSRPGHTTVECFYDGQWHYFDTFLKVYTWKQAPNAPGGRTVACQQDIKANPDLINRDFIYDKPRNVYYRRGNRFEIINEKANWTAPAFFVCGDQPKGVISGVNSNRIGSAGTKFGHMGIKFREDGYNTDVNLAPGCSLTLLWKPIEGAQWFKGRKRVPRHSCGDKEYRNCPAIGPVLEPYKYLNTRGARTFSSGRLIFQADLGSDAFLSSLAGRDNATLTGGKLVPAEAGKAASITVYLQSPYVMSRARGQAGGVDAAEISLDGGKTFKPIELKDFSEAVGGKYACHVRLSFRKAMTALKLEVIVQHNRCALPYLSPGKNTVTVTVADAKALGGNRLAVTYAYSLGSRRASYEGLCDMEAGLARAHKASWSDTPTVVQKVFAAADLPATFEVPVPTPKGRYPVYPRMLFLRREVLAPGAKPSPPPEGAVEAKVGPDDQMKEMPNPFLMGIATPPKRVVRTTKTRTIPLRCSHVVWRKKDGKVAEETFENHFIKTRPKSPEAWVMLIGGELKDLPAPRDFRAARLCIPVTQGCPKAPTQVGATSLNKPFEKNKPYDFKGFGAVLGTVIVPKQATPAPAKYYKIDVTRYVKAVAAGEAKFHGLAVRTIPNRGVDEGWTVRIDISRKEPTYIELDVYADRKPK